MARPPGCVCDYKPACTKSGTIRCNERLTWLAKQAKKVGLSSWADMNPRTNEPYRSALLDLKRNP